MKRSLNTSGATSADCSVVGLGQAGGFEFRARARVDERAAVARDPAGQALAGAHRHGADRRRLRRRWRSGSAACRLLRRRGTARTPRTARGSRASTRSAPSCRRRQGWCPSSARFRRARRFRDARARCLRRPCCSCVDSGWKPTAGRPRSLVGSSERRRGVAVSIVSAAASISAAILTNICTTAGSSARPASCCSSASAASRRHRLVVRTIGRQRVVVVDDREDSRAERNLFALQALRIALAVPAFVVAEDQRRHRIRERHGADDLGADLRMHADLLELFLRQRAGLRQDVLRHRELADVVQQRRGLDALDFGVGHAERRARCWSAYTWTRRMCDCAV